MKVGIRKPNLKKSLKARTTGKVKRQVKSAVNPFYGKKGMGWIKDPKKAAYNKVYKKVTVDPLKPLKYSSSPKTKTTNNTYITKESIDFDIIDTYPEDLIDLHLDCWSSYDWPEIIKEPRPFNDGEMGENQIKAINNPGLLGSVFSSLKDKKIKKAIEKDNQQLEEWHERQDTATLLLNGDLKEYERFYHQEAVNTVFDEFANQLHLNFVDKDNMIITYEQDLTNVPETYLYGDKEKKYNKTQYYQLVKYFTFSSILRLITETFNILPLKKVTVNTLIDGEKVIEITIKRHEIEDIFNLNDLFFLENYFTQHDAVYKFLKTKGFKALETIKEE